jgi:hypothetical protein
MTTPVSLLKNWLNDINSVNSIEPELQEKKQEFIQAINLLELNKFK